MTITKDRRLRWGIPMVVVIGLVASALLWGTGNDPYDEWGAGPFDHLADSELLPMSAIQVEIDMSDYDQPCGAYPIGLFERRSGLFRIVAKADVLGEDAKLSWYPATEVARVQECFTTGIVPLTARHMLPVLPPGEYRLCLLTEQDRCSDTLTIPVTGIGPHA